MFFMSMIVILTLPHWAYLATCSYIYYDDFGVSNLQYSALYSAGALSAFFAPFLYIWIERKSCSRRVIDLCFMLLLFAVAVLSLLAGEGPLWFLLASMPILMAEAIVRSLSIVSIISTTIATVRWSSFLFGMTVITACCIGISLS